MRTRIIAAFPGTGKSYYHKLHPDTTLDSDSSKFQWRKLNLQGTRSGPRKDPSPDFPNNYIQHIKDNIGRVEIIFVSSHKVVRQALKDNCLFFYLVYPNRANKDFYLSRFKERGDHPSFIEKLEENWDNWIRECEVEVGCRKVQMALPTLEEEVNHIMDSEGEGIPLEEL